jgi:hypothetical protein
MPSQVRCHCHGNPACKLCGGSKFYPYQPGARGWMPFRCPTCEGKGVLTGGGPAPGPCFTCNRAGSVDPGYPPYAPGWWGGLRAGWKIFFGGG